MTNIFPTILEQTSDHITFSISGILLNQGVYVCYDLFNVGTSTGNTSLYRGNYYVWRIKASTGSAGNGTVRIDNTNIINQSLAIDYSVLDTNLLGFFPFFQYRVLDILTSKIDIKKENNQKEPDNAEY